MVTIFFFFGYTKWFEYAAKIMIPSISHGPLISWLYPLWDSGEHRNGRSVCFCSQDFGIRNWESWVPSAPLLRSSRDGHDHSVHARWRGCLSGWVSRRGGKRTLPHEGRGTARSIVISSKAGRHESLSFRKQSGDAPEPCAKIDPRLDWNRLRLWATAPRRGPTPHLSPAARRSAITSSRVNHVLPSSTIASGGPGAKRHAIEPYAG